MSAEHARRIRRSRGLALARVKAGHTTLAEAILSPPKGLRGCQLYYVLIACPGVGPHHARTTCERAGVWPMLVMSELTGAQRHALVDNLPPRARTK